MDHFLDEAARIRASSASRRQAIRLLAAALAAGVFGVAGAGQASAQESLAAQGPVCGKKPCGRNKICCEEEGYKPFCMTEGKTCCGKKACGKNQGCLEDRCVKSKN